MLDGAVIVLDGVHGVETQSETVFLQANKFNVSKLFFINKLDRMGANFEESLESIKSRLGIDVLSIQMPIMKAESIEAIVDLIRMQKITWTDALGNKVVIEDLKETDAAYEEAVLRREEMIETLANYDDEVMTKLLEEKPISIEEIQKGIKTAIATRPNEVALVMCGSALKNRGI